jgi:hypothetical protein
LVEKIKPEQFAVMGPQVFQVIRKICYTLPCPDCSMHATHFLSKVRSGNIKTHEQLKYVIYVFHNSVNKRKNKPPFPYAYLEKYARMNLIVAFNRFTDVYKTQNNMKLLADNFQRQMVIKDVKQWLIKHVGSFDR